MLRMRLRAGNTEQSFDYPRRDLQLLSSKQWPAGGDWRRCAGIYESFSVAHGQKPGTWVRREAAEVLAAALAFASAVRAQADFLAHDYAYRMPAERTWLKTGGTSFPCGDHRGTVYAGPGTLFIDVFAGEEGRGGFLERIDLRGCTTFAVTEHARISVKPIPAASYWPQILPALCEFLDAAGSQAVAIAHGRSAG